MLYCKCKYKIEHYIRLKDNLIQSAIEKDFIFSYPFKQTIISNEILMLRSFSLPYAIIYLFSDVILLV